jgi:hypothetical protein
MFAFFVCRTKQIGAHLGDVSMMAAQTPPEDVEGEEGQEEAAPPADGGKETEPEFHGLDAVPYKLPIGSGPGKFPTLAALMDVLKGALHGSASFFCDGGKDNVDTICQHLHGEDGEGTVILMENLNAFYCETGIIRLPDGRVRRVPWANRYAWAQRIFGKFNVGTYIMDNINMMNSDFTTAVGQWPNAPIRIFGPELDAKFTEFLEGFKVNIGGESDQSDSQEEVPVDGEEAALAENIPPFLAMVGSDFSSAPAALHDQLKLLSSLGTMTNSFFLAGQLALTVLKCVLGVEVGPVPNSEFAELAVGQIIVSMLGNGIKIRVPIDLVAQNISVPKPQKVEVEQAEVAEGEAEAAAEVDESPFVIHLARAYSNLVLSGGFALKFGGFKVGVDPETGTLLLNPEPVEREVDQAAEEAPEKEAFEAGEDLGEAAAAADAFAAGEEAAAIQREV